MAKEFAGKGDTGNELGELFSATPGLHSLRMHMSNLASGGLKKGHGMVIGDFKRAFLHAPARRRVYVDLPGGGIGLLRKAMYGCRDSAQIWADTLAGALERAGLSQSRLVPGLFRHGGRDVSVAITGPVQALRNLVATLGAQFGLNSRLLLPDAGDEATGVYLGRRFTLQTRPPGSMTPRTSRRC